MCFIVQKESTIYFDIYIYVRIFPEMDNLHLKKILSNANSRLKKEYRPNYVQNVVGLEKNTIKTKQNRKSIFFYIAPSSKFQIFYSDICQQDSKHSHWKQQSLLKLKDQTLAVA